MRFILSRAHYPKHPGAQAGGRSEYEYSGLFVQKLRDALLNEADRMQLPAPEVIIVDGSSRREDLRMIRAAMPFDLVLEPHLNASENPSTNYAIVLHGDDEELQGAAYASAITEKLHAVFPVSSGWRVRRPVVWNAAGYGRAEDFFQATPCAAVITEPGFITNDDARTALFMPAHMSLLATAMAVGVLRAARKIHEDRHG